MAESAQRVHKFMVAKFNEVKVGARLAAGQQVLIVNSVDTLRVDLQDEADYRRTVSFYGPEFDERAFEVIPPPEPKIRR